MSDPSPSDLYWRLDAIYNDPDAARRWSNLAMLIVEWTPEEAIPPLRAQRAAERHARYVRRAVACGETREKVVMMRERLRALEKPADSMTDSVTQVTSNVTPSSDGQFVSPFRNLAVLLMSMLPAVV